MSTLLASPGNFDLTGAPAFSFLPLSIGGYMTSCGQIDVYDYLNGSLLLAWPPFRDFTPDGFNIYVNDVLWLQTQGVSYWELESGLGRWQLESGLGDWLLEVSGAGASNFCVISGLQVTTYNPSAVAAATGNSLRPQNMPPNGVVTPSGTYRLKVVAVLAGVEVAASPEKIVTIMPYSIMLVTPMKRLWPFPNTGLD